MASKILREVDQVAATEDPSKGSLSSSVNLLTLFVLAGFADRHTRLCWPSHKTLSNRSRLSPRSIRYALKALEADGHITIISNLGSSNKYLVHPGRGRTLAPRATVRRQEVPHPRHGMPGRSAGVAHEPYKNRESTTASPDKFTVANADQDSEPALAADIRSLLDDLELMGEPRRHL